MLHRIVFAAALSILATRLPAQDQTPLRGDPRAYSAREQDRAYVGARCAALYSKMAEAAMPIESERDRAFVDTKNSGVRLFLTRVPNAPEAVFLEWAGKYGQQLQTAAVGDPAKSLWGQDYELCQSTLLLIRKGDRLDRYTRDELAYLFGKTG